jgi:hypothetical protein
LKFVQNSSVFSLFIVWIFGTLNPVPRIYAFLGYNFFNYQSFDWFFFYQFGNPHFLLSAKFQWSIIDISDFVFFLLQNFQFFQTNGDYLQQHPSILLVFCNFLLISIQKVRIDIRITNSWIGKVSLGLGTIWIWVTSNWTSNWWNRLLITSSILVGLVQFFLQTFRNIVIVNFITNSEFIGSYFYIVLLRISISGQESTDFRWFFGLTPPVLLQSTKFFFHLFRNHRLDDSATKFYLKRFDFDWEPLWFGFSFGFPSQLKSLVSSSTNTSSFH